MLLLPIIIHVAGRKRHYLAIAAQSHLVVRVASTEILAGGGGGGASIFDADNIISSGDDARILVSGVSLEQASLRERRIRSAADAERDGW